MVTQGLNAHGSRWQRENKTFKIQGKSVKMRKSSNIEACWQTRQTGVIHWERKLKTLRPASNHDKMKSFVEDSQSEIVWSAGKHDKMWRFLGKSKWQTLCMPVVVAKWSPSYSKWATLIRASKHDKMKRLVGDSNWENMSFWKTRLVLVGFGEYSLGNRRW